MSPLGFIFGKSLVGENKKNGGFFEKQPLKKNREILLFNQSQNKTFFGKIGKKKENPFFWAQRLNSPKGKPEKIFCFPRKFFHLKTVAFFFWLKKKFSERPQIVFWCG